MTMVLRDFFRSSASYRVRIALNIKGIPYTRNPLKIRGGEHRSDAYLAVNPQGLVPALEHDGTAVVQSLAIVEYLEDIAPEPPLLPRQPAARAAARAMALVVACEMHPLCNLRVLEYLRRDFGQDEASVTAWYHHWMREGFAALEGMVSAHGSEQHCCGSSLSLADVFLVPQVYNAERFGCDLSAYPRVSRIAGHLRTLPAFAEAAPERQPDFVAG
jgi:maleylpyruvate isomerase